MSTGLTYVQYTDLSTSVPNSSASFVFNDYSEAYSYAGWFIRYIEDTNARMTVWTSGPSQNGVWLISSGVAQFVAFD